MSKTGAKQPKGRVSALFAWNGGCFVSASYQLIAAKNFENKKGKMAMESRKSGLWGASVAIAFVVSVWISFDLKPNTPLGEVRAAINLHQRIIAAQAEALRCLHSGKGLEECETNLDESCQGTDLNQCLTYSEDIEAEAPIVAPNQPEATTGQIRI